ncbi:MAG: metallophosphoesterase family protein, partial [Gemmatimonadota bacterium]
MIRLLHISDVHLGARLGGFGPVAEERRDAIRAAFRRLPERVAGWDVDAVLVAGDLFDNPRPAGRDVDVARETLRALAEARPVFAIPGNHDLATGGDSPWREMPRSVTVFLAPRFGEPARAVVRGQTLHVHGLAYDPTAGGDPLAGYRRSPAEGLHVVLLHAGAADHPDWTGGHGLRVTSDRLAALDADYLALGDHHRFRP